MICSTNSLPAMTPHHSRKNAVRTTILRFGLGEAFAEPLLVEAGLFAFEAVGVSLALIRNVYAVTRWLAKSPLP
jgi:hypothetical protein